MPDTQVAVAERPENPTTIMASTTEEFDTALVDAGRLLDGRGEPWLAA